MLTLLTIFVITEFQFESSASRHSRQVVSVYFYFIILRHGCIAAAAVSGWHSFWQKSCRVLSTSTPVPSAGLYLGIHPE